MILSKLNEMSVGPLWQLRDKSASAAEHLEINCAVCGRAWLDSVAEQPEVLIVVADSLTDQAEQTLLENCIRAAGWGDGQSGSARASILSLHAACSTDAGVNALQRQLAAAPVESVLVFGSEAAEAINPEFKRGLIHLYGHSGLVVTHHPAQMLAKPALKAQTWSDLCLAMYAE